MNTQPEDIFTPQGRLEDVEKNPNIDFLMNIFNIPRAFGSVSGFGGDWDVGKHSFAAALIAFFWARFNRFDDAKRDRLVALALIHDMHEAVTGDILPMLKTPGTRKVLDRIQSNILRALGVRYDEHLKVHIKIADLAAFLYEIKQVKPSILRNQQLKLAQTVELRQRENLFEYCKNNGIPKVRIAQFLKETGI